MVMVRHWFLRLATVVALVAWVLSAVSAALVAAGGIAGATGLGDYRVPGGVVSFSPTWSVAGGLTLTTNGEFGDPREGTTSFLFVRGQERGGLVREYPAEVQPVDVRLAGRWCSTRSPAGAD